MYTASTDWRYIGVVLGNNRSNVEFRVQILQSSVTGIMKLVTTGGTYVRQMSSLRMLLRRWDEVKEVDGVTPPEVAIHNFGTGTSCFFFREIEKESGSNIMS